MGIALLDQERFNSRARAGRDPGRRHPPGRRVVSIHAPARGATAPRRRAPCATHRFNSRARAGRDRTTRPSPRMKPFQFTRPRGARHSRQRGWQAAGAARFNSRARAGRDQTEATETTGDDVSIHAPARGATILQAGYDRAAGFQFTRPRGARQTSCCKSLAWACFNSRARAGRDSRRPRAGWPRRCFNSRARAGRDCAPARPGDGNQVSIHAPARGATASLWPGRRGRRFNSRARAGRDSSSWSNETFCHVSIHAPARGATPAPHKWASRQCFNSRARAGRDQPH